MIRLAALAAVLLAVPAAAHDWYSGLLVPGKAISCCDERDCAPVPHRYGAGARDEILVNGRWRPIDPRALLDSASPDGQWHACVGKNSDTPRCVIQAGGAV